jgi:hypothetical protein
MDLLYKEAADHFIWTRMPTFSAHLSTKLGFGVLLCKGSLPRSGETAGRTLGKKNRKQAMSEEAGTAGRKALWQKISRCDM